MCALESNFSKFRVSLGIGRDHLCIDDCLVYLGLKIAQILHVQQSEYLRHVAQHRVLEVPTRYRLHDWKGFALDNEGVWIAQGSWIEPLLHQFTARLQSHQVIRVFRHFEEICYGTDALLEFVTVNCNEKMTKLLNVCLTHFSIDSQSKLSMGLVDLT